ncbi:MAG TPA: tetratricopeptide repeat protein [Xanthobacteraceae bacterium]|nr:tetratricopeptide repeat protein [Xanthobacteraceae bacterium]
MSILRAALPALAALLVWSVAPSAQAQSDAQAQSSGQSGAQGQTSQRPKSSPAFPRVSVSGSYLAARHAGTSRDAAAASVYYRVALRGDPRNPELLGRAFMAVLQSGEIDESVRLADRLLQVDKSDRVARLVLGVRAIKQKQYAIARQQLAQSVRGPITDLAAALLTGWTYAGPTESKSAIDTIDKLAGPESYNLLKDLHAGLILDQSGQRREALKRLERAYQTDPTVLRVAQAYGSQLSRAGNRDEALKVFKALDEVLPRHPLVVEAIKEIEAGRRVAPLVDTVQAGAAEALYTIGAALGRRGEEVGLVYLQLALYLAPNHALAITSLADIYEGMRKPELAIKTYERVSSTSPLSHNARIQRALNLDQIERSDEAIADLERIVESNASDREAVMALGNILRARKKFAECGNVYSKAVDSIGKAQKTDWVVYYFRGICFERSKQWSKAETDMKLALDLSPDQPLVLNYLGYSWVDQGVNLEEGMRMIRRAVEQRADDGYIVDSLGWAYYRMHDFENAVKYLEQAVELKPEDPTINDHLGDAYWRIGRRLEAGFQWAHARDLKPEPEDLEKILEKLKAGLPDEQPSASSADTVPKPGGG